jgi:hypothetical protein
VRPTLEVADIFRRHGDAFRAAQGSRLTRSQRRVMAAIEACRTAALGDHVERCDDCGTVRITFNSCRDRHCPKCQGLARSQWLSRQREQCRVPDGATAVDSDWTIVTNPPYKMATQFVTHALTLCRRVIMLLRLAFLERASDAPPSSKAVISPASTSSASVSR